MKKEAILNTCYSLFRNITPLKIDCGKICNGKCCKGDGKTGMLLFPGEEKLIDSDIKIYKNENGDKFAVCDGVCNRHRRPLACRIYPLFPFITEDNGAEVIDVRFDSRADCPLTEGDFKLDHSFYKAVKRVGRYLLLNEETASFYRSLSAEIDDYDALKKIFKNF